MPCRLSTGFLLKTLRLEQSLAAAAIRSSKMSHIRRVSASHSQFGAVLRFWDSTADRPADCGSRSLRKACGYRIALSALVLATTLSVLAVSDATAQPRGSSTSGRSAPAAPPSGHQSEAIDLNEGKSAAELFQAGCSVCHQSPAGLAQGRSAGQLVGFLRQHYTSGIQHANALAGFLASAGPGRGGPATATPNRQAPVDRPPASVGNRRPPADDDAEAGSPQDRRRRPPAEARPQEANRPPEREAPAKRKPVEKPEQRPAAAARTSPQTPPAASPTAPEAAAPSSEPAAAPATAPASAPPVEKKPAAPEIPL